MSTNKTSPAARGTATPRSVSPQGSNTTQPTNASATPKNRPSAGSNTPLNGHGAYGAQLGTAVEGSASPQANLRATPNVDSPAGDQTPPTPARVPSKPSESAPGLADHTPSRPAIGPATPKKGTPGVMDPFLALAADVVDDLETVRIANENRLRQLTRDQEDADGEERGFGLTLDHPDVARLKALVDMLGDAEHRAVLNLQKVMREHPLGPWVKATKGIGGKQAARLLAAIGDPYWNDLHDRPRTVSELWAYCGLHVLRTSGQGSFDAQTCSAAGSDNPPASHVPTDTQRGRAGGTSDRSNPDHAACDTQSGYAGVAPKRQRGQAANWSTTAKTRVYLIAESCIKNKDSPYREIYDQGRTKYADATHQTPCARCGPSGTPAPEGSPLSAGHQHARALRLVMKEILKDVWREAKRLHGA